MWILCTTCGAVVADVDMHTAWHTRRGEAPPTVPDGVDIDPQPDPDQPADPDPTKVP